MIFGRSVSVIVVALAVSVVAQFGHAGFRSNAVGVVAYPPTGANTDFDGDGIDDANDTDIDDDGLANSIPLPLPTDADACPYLSDCDFDGLADADDGAPQNPDVDGDGVPDGADPDIDGDGIANAADSDPFDSSIGGDTDGDGYDDAREVADGTDPNVDQTVLDTDGDGTNDHAEILAGTDPNVDESTAIAQFPSSPFTVDCTTTPGTCVVTGTVPTNATSVTVNGAQTGTSATASQVATISGGQFTATFIGLDHTASWDFTATASGGTGVSDVVSTAVAMTPTQSALPALDVATLVIDNSATWNVPTARGGFRIGSSSDIYLAKTSTTRLTHPSGTVELEKVSGCRTDDGITGGNGYRSTWGGGCTDKDVYATLRARLVDGSGNATTQWSNLIVRGWFGGNHSNIPSLATNESRLSVSACFNTARRTKDATCAITAGGFHQNQHMLDYFRTRSLDPHACTTTRYGNNGGYVFWTNPGDGIRSTCRVVVYNIYGSRRAKTYGPNARLITLTEPAWTVDSCNMQSSGSRCDNGIIATRREVDQGLCDSLTVPQYGNIQMLDQQLGNGGGSNAMYNGTVARFRSNGIVRSNLGGFQGYSNNLCVTFSD